MKIEVDGYEIENVHMVLSGSAPHFSWIIRKDNRVLRVLGMDVWGYLKQGLEASAQSLGVIEKIEIDKSYFHLSYEEITNEQWDELRAYGKRDPRTTREVYLVLLQLLSQFSPDVVTKKGILPPSAPAAAARIAFSHMEGDTLHQSPRWAIQLALESYSGGLVFARMRGPVSNLLVGDRNSAYPTMMQMLPNPEKVRYISRLHPCMEDLIGKIGFCHASFEHNGTFIPFVTAWDGSAKSCHATGRYERQAISIYELSAGYLTKQITHITVHDAIYLAYDNDAEQSGFLYDFVHEYHTIKNQNQKGSPLYLLAKLLMNSLYGKLIELRSPESLILPKHILLLRVPFSWKSRMEKDDAFRMRFYGILVNQGMELDDLMREYQPEEYDSMVPLHELIQEQGLKAGTYFFPFYASLITAGQRAWMSIYCYYTKAVLADTDSAFSLLSEQDFIKALKKADTITTRIGVGHCRIGKELGDIDIELRNGRGHIAGIKQYELQGEGGVYKIAHHAIVQPDGEDKLSFYRYAIAQLSLGQAVTYKEKSRPVRLRSALLRGKDFGVFEAGTRTITPKQDSRMEIVRRVGNNVYYQWKNREPREETSLLNESDFTTFVECGSVLVE